MTIIRNEKQKNYTVIDNYAPNDWKLSLGARGLHSYLITQYDGWEISQQALINKGKDLAMGGKSKDGRHLIRKYLKELEELGYIVRRKVKDEKGRFSGWQSTVFERPQSPTSDLPTVEFCEKKSAPRAEIRTSVKRPLISTIDNNKNKDTYVSLQKENKKTRFPKDFKVTQEHIEYAREHNLPSPTDEFVKFKEYHEADGSTFSKWDWAFYKWLRKAKEFEERRHASSRRNSGSQFGRRSKVDIFEAATAGAFDPDP
jgi:hypothetical protein